MKVHSYIGQEPVYIKAFKCHIYPTSHFVQPVIEPKATEELDLSEYGMTEYRIHMHLKAHGPCTAKQISEAFGYTQRYIRRIVKCNPNVFCVANPGKPVTFATIEQPVITKKSVCFKIYEHLQQHGWATIPGLSRALLIEKRTVSESIRHHGELFIRSGKFERENVWRLK